MVIEKQEAFGPNEVTFGSFRRSQPDSTIWPGDPDCGHSRRARNGLIDGRSALIARCQNVTDVMSVINFARNYDLSLTVCGDGRSPNGSAIGKDRLLIDLSPLNQVQVDPEISLARVQAGAILADIDRVTQIYGLAAPIGDLSTASVTGSILNGGAGWLRRKYGLGLDNLLAVEIVTAEGRLRRAGETEISDLFRGLCSGDISGVITGFELRLHEIEPQNLFLTAIYPEASARETLRAWRDWTLTAPDEASSDVLFGNIPAAPPFPKELHDARAVIVAGLYAGSAAAGRPVFKPLRNLGGLLLDLTKAVPYLAAQRMLGPFVPPGPYQYRNSAYLDRLDDEAIETIVAGDEARPAPQTLISIRHMGGAISRKADKDSGAANRLAQYLLSIEAGWTDPADSQENIAWTCQFQADMGQFTATA